jgi:hypothetical protein
MIDTSPLVNIDTKIKETDTWIYYKNEWTTYAISKNTGQVMTEDKTIYDLETVQQIRKAEFFTR